MEERHEITSPNQTIDFDSNSVATRKSQITAELFSCSRLFLEEFEDLNLNNKENEKLSYTQEVSSFYCKHMIDLRAQRILSAEAL